MSDRSHSPLSRTDSPNPHDPNIAPQHIFDTMGLAEHSFQSPSIPGLLLRHPSPGSASSANDRLLDPTRTYEQLMASNTNLRTRVTELEVINMMVSESEAALRKERDTALHAEGELRRRITELEQRLADTEDDFPPTKRRRLSEDTSNIRPNSTIDA